MSNNQSEVQIPLVNNPTQVVNTNNTTNAGEELSPPAKAFLAYIEFIYRVLDKAGVSGINMLGSFFELNVNGKKISEQEPGELVNGLKGLSEKMADPNVQKALYIAIDRLSPVVQKSAKKFVNLFIEVFKTGLISSVAVACEVPPLSVMCGMSKSAAAFLDLAAKSMGMASSSIDDVKEAQEASKEITNVLASSPSPSINISPDNTSGLQAPIVSVGGGYIQMGGNTLKNLASIQSAGSQIEKRIGASIKHFNNPLKYYKSATMKNKNKKSNKKHRNYGTKKYKRGKRV